MSGIAMERAVEAALDVWLGRSDSYLVSFPREHTRALLEAAAPILRADERDRVLAPIRAALDEYAAMRARNDDVKFGSDATINAIRAAIGDPS